MLGAAGLRSKHSDTFSVLHNYGLPPERVIVRFGDDGQMAKHAKAPLSVESTRASRTFLLETNAVPRQCGTHHHNSLIVRAYQRVRWAGVNSGATCTPVIAPQQTARLSSLISTWFSAPALI